MAKANRGRRGIASRQCRPSPYSKPSCRPKAKLQKNGSKVFDKKDWEDVTCSVCMEFPHNAVLLLCSSHEKGCRPYMCGTSFRYSNCLDMYKKEYTKVLHDSSDSQAMDSLSRGSTENVEAAKLACPLCRGQVKGWTVVEAARKHLNAKKRSCVQDNCIFSGTYQELRKHMRVEHPSAKPREVDPSHEQKWRRLERDREREDIMSTIRSSTPGAVFFGDYVIEGDYGLDSDDIEVDADPENEGIDMGVDGGLMSVFLFLQAFGSSDSLRSNGDNRRNDRDTTNRSLFRGMSRWNQESSSEHDDDTDGEIANHGHDHDHGTSLASRLRRQGRVVLTGRSGRRRRRREANHHERR